TSKIFTNTNISFHDIKFIFVVNEITTSGTYHWIQIYAKLFSCIFYKSIGCCCTAFVWIIAKLYSISSRVLCYNAAFNRETYYFQNKLHEYGVLRRLYYTI